jgi:hypothetical protein
MKITITRLKVYWSTWDEPCIFSILFPEFKSNRIRSNGIWKTNDTYEFKIKSKERIRKLIGDKS